MFERGRKRSQGEFSLHFSKCEGQTLSWKKKINPFINLGGKRRPTLEIAVSQHSQTTLGLQYTGCSVNPLIIEKIVIDASATFEKSCIFCDVSKGLTLGTL